MSDPSSRLNLIQRAIQRDALARKGARPDQGVEVDRVAVGSEPAPASRVPEQILASAAPSIRAEVVEPLQPPKGLPVRFDAAKLAD